MEDMGVKWQDSRSWDLSPCDVLNGSSRIVWDGGFLMLPMSNKILLSNYSIVYICAGLH